MPYVETNVYVDFSDYHTDELIDELEDRGYIVSKKATPPEKVAELYKEYITYGYTEKFRGFLERFFEEFKA